MYGNTTTNTQPVYNQPVYNQPNYGINATNNASMNSSFNQSNINLKQNQNTTNSTQF